MSYGLIPLVAPVILTGVSLFTEATWWSEVLVVGSLLVSLACYVSFLPFPLLRLLLRVGLFVFILLYLKVNS